jgi:hypothetical protein
MDGIVQSNGPSNSNTSDRCATPDHYSNGRGSDTDIGVHGSNNSSARCSWPIFGGVATTATAYWTTAMVSRLARHSDFMVVVPWLRDRKFADSSVEGNGFEPLVPRRKKKSVER